VRRGYGDLCDPHGGLDMDLQCNCGGSVMGLVVYNGPSLLNGAPIINVLTGYEDTSANSKTGSAVQSWILMRDVDPRDANKSGQDEAICGHCPLRGVANEDPKRKLAKDRPCFVVIAQAPLIVWKAFHRGIYETVTPEEAAQRIKGKVLRIGSYGDGAAVPIPVWNPLVAAASKHLGYSHQAEYSSSAYNPSLYMRSVQSLAEARLAWAKKERTFRVGDPATIQDEELLCPNVTHGVQCVDCGLCNGTRPGVEKQPKSIFIPSHGSGAKYVTQYA
tara:strand:- start:3365 stop:4189 length:825 start_codon:yes stop_codon:yes gene_type:complete